MEHWLIGVISGLLGGVGLASGLAPMMNPRPMAAWAVAAKLTGQPAEQNKTWGMVLRFVWYGLVGWIFMAVMAARGTEVADVALYPLAGYALVWAALLWVVAMAWGAMLGLPKAMRAQGAPMAEYVVGTLVAHVLWGLLFALGVFASFWGSA